MIERLISSIFELRNAAHIDHWKTSSYARHVALEEFYKGVMKLLDRLVEAHQGAFGIIGDVKAASPVKASDIVQMLEEQVVWLKDNRAECCGRISALQNIVDEMVELHLSTIYKLKNLR